MWLGFGEKLFHIVRLEYTTVVWGMFNYFKVSEKVASLNFFWF